MKKWKGYVKGVNLGGWFSQCDYSKERYETFITEKDFAELSTWGIDHVRVPVDYNLLETEEGEYLEEGFAYLQRTIDWCEKYGLNMILDLHKAVGYSFDKNEDESGLFNDGALQERFYCLWEELAKHFGKYSDRVAFELLNEVTEPIFGHIWNRMADICIKRIRAIAPDVTILVGGYWNNSASAVKDIRLLDYTNVVLNFHCYEPFVFTHQAAHWLDQFPKSFRVGFHEKSEVYIEATRNYWPDMVASLETMTKSNSLIDEEYFIKFFAEAVKTAEEKDVPLYCGEYGVINNADAFSTLKWYKTINAVFKQYGIGRAAWSYRQMDFGLVDEHMSEVLDELKNYL